MSDNTLSRIFRQYHRNEGWRTPSKEWFQRLIDGRHLNFQQDSDIDRLYSVLIRITNTALQNSVGSPMNAAERGGIHKNLKRVQKAYRNLRRSLNKIDEGYRPSYIINNIYRLRPAEQLLSELNNWITADGNLAPRQGNSIDQWDNAIVRDLLGFYSLAFAFDGKDYSRSDAALFICNYMTAIKKMLESCSFLPPNQKDKIVRRWHVPREETMLQRILKVGEVEITQEPYWGPEPPPRLLRAVSVAERHWIECGGAIRCKESTRSNPTNPPN